MVSKASLCAERSRLVDDEFLRGLSESEAARLTAIDQELDRREAPAVASLERRMKRELSVTNKQISALKAKIAKNGPDRPQAKSARIP